MPNLDGTGPQGKGPMTGRGRGYCVLRESNDEPGQMQGFAGLGGIPVGVEFPDRKEVTEMPFANSAGPVASWPMIGRPVMYPMPRYAHPVPMGGVPPFAAYGMGPYGYRWPWRVRGFWRPWIGRAFGRGRRWRRDRGRFGFPW